jgi:DNA-directed RNA polymerase specialized sigma24 family protein
MTPESSTPVPELLIPTPDQVGRVQGKAEEIYRDVHSDYRSFSLTIKEHGEGLFDRALRLSAKTGIPFEEVVYKKINHSDLYLAIAVLCKDEKVASKARDEFTRRYYEPVAKKYVKNRWPQLSYSEDRVQDLFLALMYEHFPSEKTGHRRKAESKRPPLLSEYRGEGPLAAWITLTLGNMIRDSLRTTVEDVSLDEERESDEDGSKLRRVDPAEPATQPVELDRSPCMKMLKEGLSIGWQRLKPREQLVLVLQTLHKVPPSIIARKIFQVHEGTITKYTTGSLEKIHQAITEFAQSQMRFNTNDIRDCFRFAREAFPDAEDLAAGMVAQAAGGS